jgi:hypothetical protein
MADSLNDLKQRCHEKSEPSLTDKIALGELVWIKGRPASADKGTIALRSGSDSVMIIREEDIHAVREQDEEFWVQIAAETNVLVRLEKISKVHPSSRNTGECSCGTKELHKETSDMAGRSSLGTREFGKPNSHDIVDCNACYVIWDCQPLGDLTLCMLKWECYSWCR